jgi:hypothetical protein
VKKTLIFVGIFGTFFGGVSCQVLCKMPIIKISKIINKKFPFFGMKMRERPESNIVEYGLS